MDLGSLVGLVFIDLKKAFDTVDHNFLCKKLELYGLQQRKLSRFKSYLSNRKQSRRVNGIDSRIGDRSWCSTRFMSWPSSLPHLHQRSPTSCVQDCSVSMYADDTCLCCQSHDLTRPNEAINSDLRKLDTWLQSNKLSLSVAKTHSMLISTKQKHDTLKIQNKDLVLKIRDNELEVVRNAKYLGMQIAPWIGKSK